MDYELLEKMKAEELNNYLKILGLKVIGTKRELVAQVFAASENRVQTVKTMVDIESDLITEYNFPIPDPFKIPHGWVEVDERMAFWLMLSYSDLFNFSMFYRSELGSKDLSDYKNSKAFSYYKSGWL